MMGSYLVKMVERGGKRREREAVRFLRTDLTCWKRAKKAGIASLFWTDVRFAF